MAFLVFLVCLLAQDVFCNGNRTYNYNVGLLYETDIVKKAVDSSADTVNFSNFRIYFEDLLVKPDNAYNCLNSTCHFLQTYPTVGIFGLTSKINVDAIQGLCTAGNIPQILTDYVGPLNGKTQVSFYPSLELLTNAYLDILSSLGWEEFTYLYMTGNPRTKGNFIGKAQDHEFVFDIEFISPYDHQQRRSVIEKVKKIGRKYFVIDCLEVDTVRLLTLLLDFGMMSKDYHYFFTTIEPYDENISHYKNTEVDITKIQLFSSDTYNSRFKDAGFQFLAEALIFDAVQVFANALHSVKPVQDVRGNCKNITYWDGGDDLMNYIRSNSYKGLTGEISFGSDRYRDKFELFINQLRSDGMEETGTWNEVDGVRYTEYFTEEENATDDWRSKPLIVVTSLREPYVMLVESVHSLHGNDRYKGYAIDLIEELSKIIDFTYIINTTNEVGRYDASLGEWTGMIGDIQTERADLAILDIPITSNRMNVVDFSIPFMYTGTSILFKKSVIVPPNFFYFARPFSQDLWTAIAVAFVMVTISLFIVGRLCKSEWQKHNPKSKYSINQLTFLNSIWFVAGSLFRQNTRVRIRSIPGRIVAVAWWFFCFIVLAMYIAGLIAHEMKYQEEIMFTDIKSLVENAKKLNIRYGALRNGHTRNFFMSSTNPLYREVYRHMTEHPEDMVSSIDEAVEKAELTRYAFITEEIIIDYVTNRHCQLARYGSLINEISYGIALRPNASYNHPLNVAILKLGSMGKLEELKRKWWGYNENYCISQNVEEAVPVDMVDISGLIDITLLGIIMATISAIIEFILYVHAKSKNVEIDFFQVFKQEIRCCFRGNVKAVSRTVPEGAMQVATASELAELS